VANLTLVKEIITWVFDDERSCLLFKRNWTAGGNSHVAGWTLGLYVTQFEGDREARERSCVSIQRLFRGMRMRKSYLKALKAPGPGSMPCKRVSEGYAGMTASWLPHDQLIPSASCPLMGGRDLTASALP